MNNINLQGSFLNNVRREKIKISVFLISGFKISGNVIGFDSYVIFLDTDKGQQLIYKHAIASILPSKAIRLFNSDILDETEAGDK